MIRILITAENFAFGPVGKLLTVVDYLRHKGNYRFTFVGYGTAYQLAKKHWLEEVICIDTDGSTFEQEAQSLFGTHDVLLSAMDRKSVQFAQKLNMPVVWLDTLFWWWDRLPDNLLNVNCYVKQNTINDSVNEEKYGSRVHHLHSVGPIVDMSRLDTVKNGRRLLVAFGGMEAYGWYRVGEDTRYPYILTDLLIRHVDLNSYDQVIVTGNERVMDELDLKYQDSKLTFTLLSHSDFLTEVARSEAVLTVPGLETPLEIFSYRVPAIFLPPSNSSQYVQLDAFIKAGCANAAVHLRDFYPPLVLKRDDLRAMMSTFLEQLSVYEQDENAQIATAQLISNYLRNCSLLERQVAAQNEYIRTLGSAGADRAAEIIASYINTLKEK